MTEFHRHIAKTAEAACRLVGPALLTAFRSQMQIDFKVDRHDPVTEHDRRAEAAIRDFIFREVPDSTFMGEEGGSIGSGEVRWFVDPIDGTANFARGLAFWCVSVGAVIGNEVVAGAIYDPVAGNMFTGSAAGAFLNGMPMQSRAAADEQHAVLITGYPVSRDFRLDGQWLALQRFGALTETFATLRRPGSAALSIAHVAAGWVDAAAGFGVNPWDVTAAIAILRQAGGSYHPHSLGKVAPDAAAYMHPGYVALGAGANYPVLCRIAHEISAGRVGALPAMHSIAR
ncbi:MAG: inositol monophosphatase [Cypionkella sp.]|uniref:inositol monophosphatase family protein n=1 Tax=Cypionkella sp. TaxID=2811411 RepID=UPI002AB84E4F|nr:inositol monophosphatase [Cypionkella sp.]MDZ4312952.1 inositol monophosphatase [Cypionkella sp.]